MTSILNDVSALATPALIGRISADTNESENAVLDGLHLSMSTLLVLLADHCDDDHFIRQLASLAADTGVESQPGRATQPGGRHATTAEQWLESQYGDRLPSVAEGIGLRVGISRSSAESLLAIAAPLVLGYLGSALRSGTFDASGLTARLRYERGRFASAAQSEHPMMASIGDGGSHEFTA